MMCIDRMKQQEKAQEQANRGWLSSWWSGGTKTQTITQEPSTETVAGEGDVVEGGTANQANVLTEEDMRALYETIDFDENVNVFDVPKEVSVNRLRFM
jgi:hypothetical protein